MKSIFKKIAFVLALAMVVTAFPAKTAAAADGPQLIKKRVLYIDGDVTGQYADSAWASVWNKDGYSVTFASENEKVATVTEKKGKIQAVSVGETKVIATFSKDGAEDIVKKCTVVVKQNAGAVVLEETSAELIVGDTYTIKAAAKNENSTDKLHFKRQDKTSDVVSVNYDTGVITAKTAGTATILVFATMPVYNKDTDTTTAKKTTEYAEFTVTVKDKSATAEQIAWNKVALTFNTEADAKAAYDNSLPMLNTASADVTEKSSIIKLYKVLKNTNGKEQSVYLSGLTINPDNKKQVIISMFDEMLEETEYIVRYENMEAKLTTGKYVADDMKIVVAKNEILGKDSSKTTIGFELYTTGVNGQKVDITGASAYSGWQNTVDLEDLSTADYHAEYTLDTLARVIWFYTENQSYTVSLKATFDDWYMSTGSSANRITTTNGIHPGDSSVVLGSIKDWCIVAEGTHADASNTYAHAQIYSKKAFAAEDAGRQLLVALNIKENGTDKVVYSCDDTRFTFVSSNDDKLAINKETGALYPPKEPQDTVVNVHVYYDEKYVGTVGVTVYAKRVFTGFTAVLSDTKLHYNSATGIHDALTLTMKPVDQLGDAYNNPYMVYGVTFNGDGATYVDKSDNGDLTWTISANSTGLANVETIKNIRAIATATYDDGISRKITRNYAVSFTTKNTKGAEAKTYKLVAAVPAQDTATQKNTIDMKVDSSHNTADDFLAEITAYSYDKDGFKIKKLNVDSIYSEAALNTPAATTTGAVTIAVRFGKDYIQAPNVTTDGALGVTVKFQPVLDNQTATLAGISKTNVITKVKAGTYSVNLFVGNGTKAVYRDSLALNVKDSQTKVTWKWDKYTTSEKVTTNAPSETEVEAVLADCFTFKYGNTEVDANIYVEAGDYTIKGNTLTIKKARYQISEGGQIFEQEIDIMRTVTVNQ